MKLIRSTFVILSSCGLSLGALGTSSLGQTGGANPTATTPGATYDVDTVPSTTTEADNTKRNEKVTKNAEVTAQDQGNSQEDINLAAKVRRAIVDDDSLSTNAHNIKVIASNGQVLLKGPVKSDSERTRLSQIANEIVGVSNVKIEIEVSH